MKARIAQRDLAAATRSAGRRLPPRPMPATLGGLLVEASGNQLTVTGYDLETATRHTVPADVAEPGRALIPGRLLSDITGGLPGDDVDLTVGPDEAGIASGGASFGLTSLDAADYPRLPPLPPVSGTVAGDLLASAVLHAAGAVDPKAAGNMAALAGVHVEPDGERLRVTATDRYCVVQHWLPWEPSWAPTRGMTFPVRPLSEAVRAVVDGDVAVSVPADGMVGGVSSGGFEAVMRVIDAPFPQVDRLMPTEFSAVAAVAGPELLAVVKRLAVVIEEAHPLLLEFTDDSLTVSAGYGTHARGIERVDAALDGADRFRIAYRASYLATVLSVLDGEAQFDLVSPIRPSLIHSTDNQNPYRSLVMPVRHEWTSR